MPWGDNWPANIWLGTSVENQTVAEKRLPFLLKNPAAVRFLSCEPLLGQLNLRPWFNKKGLHPIDWIIAGGESGAKSRPMHPDWAVSLLQQCQEFTVPFHFKQWGHWVPAELVDEIARPRLLEISNERPVNIVRLSKKLAGRAAFLKEPPGMGCPTDLLFMPKVDLSNYEGREQAYIKHCLLETYLPEWAYKGRNDVGLARVC